jgi:hypothetical protein
MLEFFMPLTVNPLYWIMCGIVPVIFTVIAVPIVLCVMKCLDAIDVNNNNE